MWATLMAVHITVRTVLELLTAVLTLLDWPMTNQRWTWVGSTQGLNWVEASQKIDVFTWYWLIKYFLTVIPNKRNQMHVTVFTIKPISHCDWWRQWFMLLNFILFTLWLQIVIVLIFVEMYLIIPSNLGWIGSRRFTNHGFGLVGSTI